MCSLLARTHLPSQRPLIGIAPGSFLPPWDHRIMILWPSRVEIVMWTFCHCFLCTNDWSQKNENIIFADLGGMWRLGGGHINQKLKSTYLIPTWLRGKIIRPWRHIKIAATSGCSSPELSSGFVIKKGYSYSWCVKTSLFPFKLYFWWCPLFFGQTMTSLFKLSTDEVHILLVKSPLWSHWNRDFHS